MRYSKHLRRLVWVMALTAGCAGAAVDPPTPENMRNRPILSKPLLERKLIVAHHMTAWVGWPEAPPFARTFNPVPGGSAADVVGTKSVCPMYGLVRDPPLAELDEAVLHELKSAVRMGLDGFQFFYPIHMHDGFLRKYSRVVKAFIKQAEQHAPDFRVTLCLCAPGSPASEEEMRAQWAEHIRWILADTADSPVWLRSPDGRLIVYTWVPEGFVDAFRRPGKPHIHSPAGIAATAVAYEKLAREIGEEIAYIFHMRGRSDDAYAELIYDYFPAAWRWTEGNMSTDVPRLAAMARRRKRLFSPSVYPGFFGHTYKVGKKPSGSARGKVGEDPVDQLWRPYTKTQQTRLYRDLLDASVKVDAQLISFITWNDYTEATQLIPEVNYNFVPGVLLNYYRSIWLGNPERNDREIAIVSYKKHRIECPLPTDVVYRVTNEHDYGALADESCIEVVTILKEPATIHVNGKPCGEAGPGLASLTVPFAPGRPLVEVKRDGADIMVLHPSEAATDAPRRNDPVSVMLSTEFDRYLRDIYGRDAVPYRLREYQPTTTRP